MNAPARRRIRLRPTALGWKAIGFHALLVTAFYVSPYTNLFFLMLTFFTTLLALSTWWTRSSIVHVTGRIVAPMTIEADKNDVPVRVELTGHAAPGSTVRLTIAGRPEPAVIATCDAATNEDAARITTGRLPRLPRGVWTVRTATLCSTAPSGLWMAQVACDAPEQLFVHAALLPDTEFAGRHGDGDLASSGARSVPAHDRGASGLRDWRGGDALRTVDWRATARRRRPIVREYEGGTGESIAVVFDRRLEAADLERALSELVTIARHAQRQSRRVALHSQDVTATYGDGARPFDELLRWTAEANRSNAALGRVPSDAVTLPRGQGTSTPLRTPQGGSDDA